MYAGSTADLYAPSTSSNTQTTRYDPDEQVEAVKGHKKRLGKMPKDAATPLIHAVTPEDREWQPTPLPQILAIHNDPKVESRQLGVMNIEQLTRIYNQLYNRVWVLKNASDTERQELVNAEGQAMQATHLLELDSNLFQMLQPDIWKKPQRVLTSGRGAQHKCYSRSWKMI